MTSDFRVTSFGDIESEVNDLADMAAVLSGFAEAKIDIPLRAEEREAYRLSDDDRKAVMYGIYQIALLARQLRENYYAATEADKAM